MPASPESADIRLSVCYALPDAVFLREIAVAAGTTILDAIQLSGLTTAHPEVDPTTARVGIYGKLKTLDTIVREGPGGGLPGAHCGPKNRAPQACAEGAAVRCARRPEVAAPPGRNRRTERLTRFS